MLRGRAAVSPGLILVIVLICIALIVLGFWISRPTDHSHDWAWSPDSTPHYSATATAPAPIAEAVSYVLNQWTELSVFASDGAVAIDNNISEREMKRVVLNRKKSLFVGNQRGGETAAILSSLTSTCRRHRVNPQIYLTRLLTNLPATPIRQIAQWLPDQWRQRNIPAMP